MLVESISKSERPEREGSEWSRPRCTGMKCYGISQGADVNILKTRGVTAASVAPPRTVASSAGHARALDRLSYFSRDLGNCSDEVRAGVSAVEASRTCAADVLFRAITRRPSPFPRLHCSVYRKYYLWSSPDFRTRILQLIR
jgi:hypothetical protein